MYIGSIFFQYGKQINFVNNAFRVPECYAAYNGSNLKVPISDEEIVNRLRDVYKDSRRTSRKIIGRVARIIVDAGHNIPTDPRLLFEGFV